jgi:hypothetical protein
VLRSLVARQCLSKEAAATMMSWPIERSGFSVFVGDPLTLPEEKSDIKRVLRYIFVLVLASLLFRDGLVPLLVLATSTWLGAATGVEAGLIGPDRRECYSTLLLFFIGLLDAAAVRGCARDSGAGMPVASRCRRLDRRWSLSGNAGAQRLPGTQQPASVSVRLRVLGLIFASASPIDVREPEIVAFE